MKRKLKLWIIALTALTAIMGLAAPAWADAYLRVRQTAPDVYVNDSAGRTYTITADNTGDQVAENVALTIDVKKGGSIASGFSYVSGSMTALFRTDASDLTGTPVNVVVSGSNPASVTFELSTDPGTPLSLAPGQILELSYKIATDSTIDVGNLNTLTVTDSYTENSGTVNHSESFQQLLDVKGSQLSVSLTPISPLPFQARRGQTVVLEAKVTNGGDGSAFNVDFNAAWGVGFGSPQVIAGNSNISPILNGNQFQILIDEIQPGQSKTFQFQLSVDDYKNFALTSTATDYQGTYNDLVLFVFIMNQPNISVQADNISIDYGNSATAHIRVANVAGGNQGAARQFKLYTGFDAVFNVSNVSSGWSYANGVFTYTNNSGVLNEGDTVDIYFDVLPKTPAGIHSGVNGSIRVAPSYTNDIDQPFSFPVVYPTYAYTNVPTLSLAQNIVSEATDGDNYRVFLGEHFYYEFTPTLTHPDKWKNGQEIVLTDTITNDFTVAGYTATLGTVDYDSVSGKITWRLTPDEAALSPRLTVNLQTTTDPNRAGNYLYNSAFISGVTVWNWTLSDTRNTTFFLQSRDEPAIFDHETKYITNLPSEGRYDVCGVITHKNEIAYQLDYIFGAGSGGTWSGSTLTDELDQGQVYKDGTFQYKIGSGPWTDVPSGSIVSTSPTLIVDLGFLTALIGDDNVQGRSIYFRYTLKLTDNSLPSGNTTGTTFVSRTNLTLNNATGGAGADGNVFFEGVFVPISRAAMDISAGFNVGTVYKGQTVRVTVNLSKLTPWNNNNLKVTLTTNGNFVYLGNMAVNGFGGLTNADVDAEVTSAYPDVVTFTFKNPLTVNLGGTISFDMVKTDTDSTSIQTKLDFDDDLNVHYADSATAAPAEAEGTLSLAVNPNPVKVTAKTVTWNVTVTNMGEGTAYGVVVDDILKHVMDYSSSTVNETGASPAVVDLGDGTSRIRWTIGTLSSGQSAVIAITAQLNGSTSDFSNANWVTGRLTWVDRDAISHTFNTANATGPQFVETVSSSFIFNLVDNPLELCQDTTIKFDLKNNGTTANYNYILTQDFQQTGFEYIPGSARITNKAGTLTVPVADPAINGTVLTFAGIAQLQALNPQDEWILLYDVHTHEDFNSYQKIRSYATWQKPSEEGGSNRTGSTAGAEYRVPLISPNISVAVTGLNSTAGDSTYSENVVAVANNVVVWRIQVNNTGAGALNNVTLNNVIPSNMTFVQIAPDAGSPAVTQTLTPGQSWKIPNIPAHSSATYLVTAKFTGNTAPPLIDRATVTWGPETSSLATPGDNDDTANFITQPTVTVTEAFSNFTTKSGTVTLTIDVAGAPAYDLHLPLDITNRFKVDSGITYSKLNSDGITYSPSTELGSPASQPAFGAEGNTLVWNWSGPIPVGRYTITFNIRDANNNCNNNARINTTNGYTFKDSWGVQVLAPPQSYVADGTPGMAVLAVTKTPTIQIAQDGAAVSWDIDITNNGDADATNLEIVDMLGDGTKDNGFTYTSASLEPTNKPLADNTLIWGGLTLGAHQTMRITVHAIANAAGRHQNKVTATEWNVDKTAKVDQKTASASVAMVNITQTVDQTTGNGLDPTADSFGEVVKYTITTTISDEGAYRNLKIKDTLPNGAQYIDGSGTFATANNLGITATSSNSSASKNLEWDLSDFNGPETITITYLARIVKEGSVVAGDWVNNTAKVGFDIYNAGDGSTSSYPDTMSELQSTAKFTVAEPNISMTRSSSPASGSQVGAGQVISHTLTVTNANMANASPGYGVNIAETIPVGELTTDPQASLEIVKGGTPLVKGVDYTANFNSGTGVLNIAFLDTSLGILKKNESFTITYNTTVDAGIGSGRILDHSAVITAYDSQPSGTPGVQSYSGTAQPTTYSTDTSMVVKITPADNVNITPGTVVSFDYRITIHPGTTVYGISLNQTLPPGMDYKAGSSVGLSYTNGTVYQTLTPNVTGDASSGETLTWASAGDGINIVNSTGSDMVLKITFDAVVLNAAPIVKGAPTSKGTFTYNYNTIPNDGSSRTNLGGIDVNFTVVEPQLAITENFTPSGPYEGGSTLHYQLSVKNNGTSTAYDAQIVSMLPAKVTFSSQTPSVSTTSFSQNGQQLTWGGDGALDIQPGQTVTFDVYATLNNTVEPNEALQKTGTVTTYSSMDGTVANERPYGPTSATTTNATVNDPTAVAKTIVGTPTYTIGETFDYKLVVTVLKGTTENLNVQDTLPTGVELESYTITNGNTNIAYAAPTGTHGAGAINTINWNFGTVVNSDTGVTGETITIQYTVKILDNNNNLANGTNKTNSAKASYSHYASGSLASTNTTTKTVSFKVKEPKLVMSKTYSGGSDAGDTVTCTIKIWHNPSASPNDVTAYDVAVGDPVPAGMTFVSASNGGALNAGSVNWTIASIPVSYNSSSNAYTITYTMTVDNTVKPNQTFNSTANMTWTSLSGNVAGERTGADGPGGLLNNYAVTQSGSFTTADRSALVKTITGSGPYPVGSTVHYRIVVTLNEGTTNNVVVKDDLPTGVMGMALMKFGNATITKGNAGMSYPLTATPTSGDTGTIVWNFGDVTNPADGNTANDTITIDYTAIVQNVGGNTRGTPLNNNAHLEYKDGANANKTGPNSNGGIITVVEPQLTVAMTELTTGPYKVGDTVVYKVTVSNTNGTNYANAYDLRLTDILPAGLSFSACTADPDNPGAPQQTGQQMDWGTDGSIDLTKGGTYSFRISAVVTGSVEPEQGLSNSISVAYTSTDGINVDERSYNAISGTVTVTTADDTALNAKTVVNSPTYVIGDVVTYQLTMTVGKGITRNVVVHDSLPDGMAFVSAAVAADPGIGYTMNSQPGAGAVKDIAWDFGTIANSGSGGTITIQYTVRIQDVSGNLAGNTRANLAYVSYLNSAGTTKNTATRSQTFTIKEPQLTMSKTYTAGSSDAGDTVTCTIKIWHNAPSNDAAAYDVNVSDPVPTGMTFVTADNGGGFGGGAVHWTIPSIGTGYNSSANAFVLTYTMTLDNSVGPKQTLGSTATTTWTSLSGSVAGERTGAGDVDNYSATMADSLQTADRTALTKTITGSGPYPVGSKVHYRLVAALNEGTTDSVVIKDILPAGMKFESATVTKGNSNISTSLNVSPTAGSEGTLIWNFGDVTDPADGSGANDKITIDYTAIIENVGGNIRGTDLANSAHLEYVDGTGAAQTTASSGGTVAVVEPELTLSFTEMTSGPYRVGQTITYKVTVSHAAGSNATAYDLKVTDNLPTGLTYDSVTADPDDPGAPQQAGQQVIWGNGGGIDLPVGSSYSFQIHVKMATGVEPEQTLSNAINLTWTSTDGTNPDERTGSVNSGTIDAISTDGNTLGKTVTGSPSYVVGEGIDYQLTIKINAGTTRNVVAHDALPSGMTFVGSTITSDAGISYTLVSQPVQGDTDAIAWDFGTVVNSGSGDTITIHYTAKIADSNLNRAGDVKTNSAYMAYVTADGNPKSSVVRHQSFTVKEPQLVMTKTYTAGSYDAGDTVHVTLRIWHNPTADPNDVGAYDVSVADPVPTGMNYLNGTADNGGTLNGSNLTWTVGSVGIGVDAAHPLILQYDLKIADTAKPGQTLGSTATTTWTSLAGNAAGERTGAGGVDNYLTTAGDALQTANHTAFTKTVIGSGPYPIGSKVHYRLTATLNEGTTNSVVIKDALPAGMKFESATITKGNAAITTTLNISPVAGNEGTLVWNFGDATDPADGSSVNDTLTIDYTAIIEDVGGNARGTALTNIAHLEYVDGTGAAQSTASSSGTVTVVEPQLALSLTEVTTGPYKTGDTVTYRVTISHAAGSNATAYDLKITDNLPAGLTYDSTAAGPDDPGAPQQAGQQLVWGNGGAIDLPVGNTFSFLIHVKPGTGVQPDQLIGNTVNLTWTSTDGVNPDERTGNLDSSAVTVGIADHTDLAKTIAGSPTFVIGENIDYQLVLTVNGGTTRNLIVYDTLPSGVSLVSASIDHDAGISYTLNASPNPGATGTIAWNFGNVVNAGTGNTLTIRYTVKIINASGNQAGDAKANSAYASYLNSAGNSKNTATRSRSFTMKEPRLDVSKAYSGGSFQAGSVITCTVQVWHDSTASPHDVNAYDVVVSDAIPAGMVYVNGSADNGGGLSGGKIVWNLAQLDTAHDGDHPLILTYQVVLDDSVKPGQQLTSAVDVTWESLAGSMAGERTGADGPGGPLNNYAATTSATTNTVDNSNLTHSATGGVEYTVGATVPYRIQITLNEGTTTGVQVKATLPAGMQYVGATLTKGNNGIGYPALTSPQAGDTGALVWNFGTVVNPSDGNGADDTITIDYQVLVDNVPGNIQGTALTIPAHLEYVDGQSAGHVLPNRNADITLAEPNLGITKTGPDNVALKTAATYTVQVQNTGNATAWQTTLVDTIPAEMRAQTPVITAISVGSPTRILHESGPDDYDVNYDASTGQWTIRLKSAAARIAPGETLTVSYQAILNNEPQTVHAVTNTVAIGSYYSVDSSGGVGPETRTYPASPVTASKTSTILTPVLVITGEVNKTEANPGEVLHYKVTIVNNGNTDVANADFSDVVGVDFQAGTLTHVTAGSGTVTATTSGGSNGNGSIGVSGIAIPKDGGQVVLEWDVTLKPVLPDGTQADEAAQFTVGDLPAPLNVDIPKTLIHSAPILTVTKQVTDLDGGVLLPGNTIRYTVTISNTGNENAKNVVLKDLIPSNASYVAGSTTLNGTAVPDIDGTSALASGLAIHTPGEADGWVNAGETAVVVFRVVVDSEVVSGTIISNQATLDAEGEGSGPRPTVLSDDPDTDVQGDATRIVVGNVPSIYAVKTVADDNGGGLNPDETITYTVTIDNQGTVAATNASYSDRIPDRTAYVPGTATIDGSSVPDAVQPDGSFTYSLGTLAAGGRRTLTFRVRVNSGTNGEIISSQGTVGSAELPDRLTDADGNPANGSQPTEILVGSGAALRLTKLAADVNGGSLYAGETVEFTLTIRNIGNVNATHVTIADSVPGTLNYVAHSATRDGLAVSDSNGGSPLQSAGLNIGTLAPGETAIIRYRVTVAGSVFPGTVIDTQASYTADNGLSGISDSDLDDGIETGNSATDPNDDDPTRIQTGANPGTANISGSVWWDMDYNNVNDAGEVKGSGWRVDVLQQETLIATTTTDSNGNYQFTGLVPGNGYRVRFTQPDGAVVWKIVEGVDLHSGTIVSNVDLPLHPTGVVYDAVMRQTVAGATVRISGPAGFDPAQHLLPGEQGQVTAADGRYHFEILFSKGAPNGVYTITVTPPSTYSPSFPSTILPPQQGTYSPGSGGISQVVAGTGAPANGDPVVYYLTFNLSSGSSETVNNHIAVDPIMRGAVLLTKTAAVKTGSIGAVIPYTIRLENQTAALITPFTLQDAIPAGFKYVPGSARINGVKVEPQSGRVLTWTNLTLQPHGTMTVTYNLVIGAGVTENQVYRNTAVVLHGVTGTSISNTGEADIQVVSEPVFSQAVIIGKVFYDLNGNGIQDDGEDGIAGARIVTVSGKIVTTDAYGRYHIDDIDVPDFTKGTNFILKLDPKSIPAGSEITTENPCVIRVTQGMMIKVNFGVKPPKKAEDSKKDETPKKSGGDKPNSDADKKKKK